MNAGSKNLEESKTRKLNFWYTKIDTLTQTKHQELIKLIEDKKNPPCNCSRLIGIQLDTKLTTITLSQ